MSYSYLYPEPPHVSAALYLDGVSPKNAFTGVCERVISAGATPTGVLETVHSMTFPRFTMISDMTPQLELVQLNLQKGHELEEWIRWLHTQDPVVHILRAGFAAPQADLVVVGFEPIPEESDADIFHPIAVTMSGSLLSMPPHVSLTKRKRTQAVRVARFLMTVFRSVCESLDPLYGSIAVEASLPTPVELVTGDTRVGTELFFSTRLVAVDRRLERDVATIFAGGFSERWTTGVFFSGWAVFNPEGRTVDAPLAVSTNAARRLGKALKRQMR